MGEMISFTGNGQTYQGYLARSATGEGPGVIVIQEWWGLVGHIKEVCDRFASEGFTALAPDLYKGKKTDDPDEAGKLMMALNIAEAEKILRGAVDGLIAAVVASAARSATIPPTREAMSSRPASGASPSSIPASAAVPAPIPGGEVEGEVGVVGFCMGGQLALFAACTNPKIGACVDFYGIHPNVNPPFNQLQAPVLGFFAERDAYASPEAVAKLDTTLSELGKEHQFITYPGTNHAFFNNDRPEVYDAKAAEDSWKRMVGFFRTNL